MPASVLLRRSLLVVRLRARNGARWRSVGTLLPGDQRHAAAPGIWAVIGCIRGAARSVWAHGIPSCPHRRRPAKRGNAQCDTLVVADREPVTNGQFDLVDDGVRICYPLANSDSHWVAYITRTRNVAAKDAHVVAQRNGVADADAYTHYLVHTHDNSYGLVHTHENSFVVCDAHSDGIVDTYPHEHAELDHVGDDDAHGNTLARSADALRNEKGEAVAT